MAFKTPVRQRFQEKFVFAPDSGCWLWTAKQDKDGYGIMWNEGKNRRAHRISYEIFREPIPEGLQIDHLCRTTCCVNPLHIEPVTAKENNVRGNGPEVSRQRQLSKTHCPKGHPYFGDNLFICGRGKRECRACRRERGREYMRKRRQKT